jgi:hypothetical protein
MPVFTGVYVAFIITDKRYLVVSKNCSLNGTFKIDVIAVLEKVQQRAVAMVSGLKGTTDEKRLCVLADMLQTFKIIRGFF